jgi:hypothetical protein
MDFKLWDITDTILDTIYELKHVKKRDLSLKVTVKMLMDNTNVETYEGLLTEDRRILYVHKLERMYPKPFLWSENGRQICYIPEKGTANVNYNIIKNIALGQSYNVIVKWQHMRKWITTKVIKCNGTIDWTVFNHDFNPDMAADSYLVMHTTALKFLKEMANIKFLLACLASMLFGWCMGFGTEAILNILYRLIQK